MTATPAPRRCPRCDDALRDDQRWCLSCGLAVASTVARAAWRPPLVAAAALGAVALVALVLAFVLLTRDDNPVAPTTPALTAAPAGTTTSTP